MFPVLHIALVIVNLAVHLAVLGLQLATSCLGRRPLRRIPAPAQEPFVTLLVPAHNEPPEVLGATLRSLQDLDWDRFEVVVVDNNTRDAAVWRPVEALCQTLGPRFRFLHVEGLEGAKAGALNWVRPQLDPRTEFVLVVDADYLVKPSALRRGIRYFSEPQIGLVQFPQEYRNIGPANVGLALDFKHFFAGYMNMANHLGCVPSTGTLSLIRLEALDAVGGFHTDVVTEDADLGLRLNLRGFRSVYAPEVVGHGLIPHDLESLKKQRWRWAFGNAQILKLNWRRLLWEGDLSFRQRLGYLVHLTAWFNFNLVPRLTLILMAPLAWWNRMHPLQPYLVVLSGFTLLTFLVLRFGTLYYSLRREGHGVREIALAFLSHWSLDCLLGFSWVRCLADHRAPFVRTNKFLRGAVPGILRLTLVEAATGLALLAACAVLTVTDFIIGPVAALMIGGGRFLVYWLWWQSKTTWRITEALGRRAEDDLQQALDATEPEPDEPERMVPA
ncbi:MAG: glycosyltransferase [Verrucomicrobia bacterium]|nr:glycosyltransferase [Verrucomicrobiota bacterium]